MYTNSAVVSDNQNQSAQRLSSKLNSVLTRKRAYIDFMGANFAINSFVNLGIRANQDRSIFKSARLYLDYEVVDIYCNSHMLYVLTSYGVSSVRVPLNHKNYNMLPEAYIVVDLKIGMKSADIKGVIYPSDLTRERLEGKGYKFDINSLHSFEEFLPKIKKYAGIKPSIGRHLDCMNLFMPYIDGKLSQNEKIKLIEHVLSCETCKKRLVDAVEFDAKAKKIKNQKKLLTEQDTSTRETFVKRLQNKPVQNINRKDAIDVIYKDEKIKELKETFKGLPEVSKRTKRLIIVSCAIVLVLLILVVFAFNIPKNHAFDENSLETASSQGTTEYAQDSNRYEISIPQMKKNKAYTTVSKVSWEVSDTVDDEQKKFLQSAGKSVRLNLQNDLLLSNEAIVSPKVKFGIKFQKNGSVEEINVEQTSGSGAVDEVIRQSIANTLQYMHPPKGSFAGKKNSLTLVIDF